MSKNTKEVRTPKYVLKATKVITVKVHPGGDTHRRAILKARHMYPNYTVLGAHRQRQLEIPYTVRLKKKRKRRR